MLNLSFLACTKVELWDLAVCGKMRKNSKSRHDLDLDLTMPNIELVRVIYIYYKVFKFHVPRSMSRSMSHTRGITNTLTDTHKDLTSTL